MADKLKNKSLVSLFSGALGLDIGLHKAGYKICSIVECDPMAIKTAKDNLDRCLFPDTFITEKKMDVDNIHSICAEIMTNCSLKKGDLEILAGAPPCQPFSTAGKRRSITDVRGDGFSVFFQSIKAFMPKYFVIENVKGILSAAIKHRPLAERGSGFPQLTAEEEYGSAFSKILDELSELAKELGYCVSWGVLNAANFGCPQSRERLIIIGSREGHFIWPEATHSKEPEAGKKPWVTLREVFNDFTDPNPLFRPFSESVRGYLDLIPTGGNWRDLPSALQEKAIGGAYHSWGGRSGFLRRLDWNKPSPTITQSPASKATMLCHPVETRPLSVSECARIQQFPSNWKFCGGISQQYKQIGNATPIGLAEAIGNAIKNCVDDEVHKGELYCADAELLERITNRPKTMLNPAKQRKVADSKLTKLWMDGSDLTRHEFKKYRAFGA